MRSGYICDQSRKLSKIAPNFGRFFANPNFVRAQLFQKLYPNYNACLPLWVCTSKPWSISSASKNLRGQHPLRAEIYPRKSRFGWVQTHMSYFMDSGPMFTGLVSPNAEEIVFDHIPFQFWKSQVVLEIFAIKVGSCVKSHQILHVLAPNFLGGSPEFLDLHKKFSQTSIMWQSFTVIGRRSCRRSCGEIKSSVVKHKVSGRPNYKIIIFAEQNYNSVTPTVENDYSICSISYCIFIILNIFISRPC